MFPDDLKIAKATPVFKAGDNKEHSNNRSISVQKCFSKILERVLYNRLYKYLLDSNILYKKHSTDYVVLQLADQIHNDF